MFDKLEKTISTIMVDVLSKDRKEMLQPLIDYIQEKVNHQEKIRLNFICTHNSRRSHLSQIWAQTMAFYYEIPNVACYSAGTEATALFYMVAETLKKQGFEYEKLDEGTNPIYAIKFDVNEPVVIAFSKTLQHAFNPISNFAAVMTCSSANEACPFVSGAEKRFSIQYEDPKKFDNTDKMEQGYWDKSIEIATEMAYVFSKIQNGK
ncbi:MAG: protein-tyrosine-phosphatase [Flavobacterium sp.]|uniref:arsenate-mycothiol transferase ArsC n=1 Tax=Flavobacterium sp. TaxID=239 RepID=UPI000C6B97DC|nr:protein-tyrosine-phosphatase [Flavobacterium sp.]MBF01747.1 protein-tyrosine-phosphatase [Flavobacterium sp.]